MATPKANPATAPVTAASSVEVKVEDGNVAAPAINKIAKAKAVSKDTFGNKIEEN